MASASFTKRINSNDDDDDEISYLEVFDINNNGLGRKEINVIVDGDGKLLVLNITPIKIRDK